MSAISRPATTQFQCLQCDKNLASKRNLERHARTHTGEKPFASTTCDKRFSDATTLSRHARTHTGEKPYACGICDKRFSLNGNRKRHVALVHIIGGKKLTYVCDVCGMTYSRRCYLVRHRLLHDEQP